MGVGPAVMGHPLPAPSSTVLLVNFVIGVAVIVASRVPRLGEAGLREGFKAARVTSTPHAAIFGSSICLGLKARQPAPRAAQSLHSELHDGVPASRPQ